MKVKSFLSVGAGPVRYKDTTTLDIDPSSKPDIVASADNIPVDDETFEGVIASHIIEHFFMQEHFRLLIEWNRVIKDGGTLFVGCPDIVTCMKNYLSNKKGLRRSYWYQTIYGDVNLGFGYAHKSGLDQSYLTDILFKTGFRDLVWTKYDENQAHNLGVTAIKKREFYPKNLILKPRKKNG